MKRVGFVLSLLLAAGSASAMTYFLKDQWVDGGKRFCRYSNGTVLNVGVSLCPLSIEG
jgi:hypothetical protein